jgi:hypothetical protein
MPGVRHLFPGEQVKLMRLRMLLGAILAVCMGVVSHPVFAQADEPARPNVCEDALALLETAAVDARKDKVGYIIVVARLGNGEKSQSLNQKRLKSALPYLESRAGNKVVAASGEKVSGYGRLELYVSGRLLYVIAFPKNRLIDCSGIG